MNIRPFISLGLLFANLSCLESSINAACIAGLIARVVWSGLRESKPLAGATHCPVCGRPLDQMTVMGHQTVRKQLEMRTLECFTEKPLKRHLVFRLVKDGGARIPATGNQRRCSDGLPDRPARKLRNKAWGSHPRPSPLQLNAQLRFLKDSRRRRAIAIPHNEIIASNPVEGSGISVKVARPTGAVPPNNAA